MLGAWGSFERVSGSSRSASADRWRRRCYVHIRSAPTTVASKAFGDCVEKHRCARNLHGLARALGAFRIERLEWSCCVERMGDLHRRRDERNA